MSYQSGDSVRFTSGPLGLLAEITNKRFVSGDYVKEGDVGIYQGPHPHITEEDWHVVQVGEWVCPVHGGMIEKVE